MGRGQIETAELDWRPEGTPVSVRFDDPYFSIVNGMEETRHVFLGGNHLPERFQPGFKIAELGFGTGLNMLVSWKSWLESGQDGVLHFTSFEAFPVAAEDMRRALSCFSELTPLAEKFLTAWETGKRTLCLEGLVLCVIVGDARQTVPAWANKADAWFLDGFSPAKNPELWGPDLLRSVAEHTRPGGSFATYSAAGHIRRSLSEVGFRVDRVPGFGRKRHMSVGILEDTE